MVGRLGPEMKLQSSVIAQGRRVALAVTPRRKNTEALSVSPPVCLHAQWEAGPSSSAACQELHLFTQMCPCHSTAYMGFSKRNVGE